MREQGLQELTDRERDALRLVLDHSFDEIGRTFGVSKSAVAQRLTAAKAKLGTNSARDAARFLGEHEGWLHNRTGTNEQVPDTAAPGLLSLRQRIIGLLKGRGERNDLTGTQKLVLTFGAALMVLLFIALLASALAQLGTVGQIYISQGRKPL